MLLFGLMAALQGTPAMAFEEFSGMFLFQAPLTLAIPFSSSSSLWNSGNSSRDHGAVRMSHHFSRAFSHVVEFLRVLWVQFQDHTLFPWPQTVYSGDHHRHIYPWAFTFCHALWSFLFPSAYEHHLPISSCHHPPLEISAHAP